MRFLAPLLFVSCVALADVGFRQGGNASFLSVRDIECGRDGGLLCLRDAGTTIGQLRCNSATATEPGCVTPEAQNWTGNKTIAGNVKAVIVDAGIGAIGELDLRANALTGRGTTSTLTIQSNTSDGTTSSSVAAMTFKLGANINNGDLGWRWEDSSGTKQLACTEAGTVYFRALATDTGAATVAGEDFTAALGNGGPSSGAVAGGTGGAFSFTAGTGGASAGSASGGVGGASTLLAGNGGTGQSAQTGGVGGATTVRGGVGGTGANGGAAAVTGGRGGNANSFWAAGTGGAASVTGGQGGNESSGSFAGVGGAVSIVAGAGGDNSSGTSGVGGALTLRSGAGGDPGAAAGSASGAVTVDTGAASGSATNGSVTIGGTNANVVSIGRAGKGTAVVGDLAVGEDTLMVGTLTIAAGGTAISAHISGTGSLDFNFDGAGITCQDLTVTVTGAADGDTVVLGLPNALMGTDRQFTGWVSASNTVTVRGCDVGSVGGNPAAATVRADVWKH